MTHDPDNRNSPDGHADPLARELARLEPAPAALNRDRLMFEAGAASRRPVVRLWQFTAGILAAAGFVAGMYFKPPSVVERVVYVEAAPEPPAPVPVPEVLTPAPLPVPDDEPEPPPAEEPYPFFTADAGNDLAGWWQLRHDVLTGGLGLLPDHGRRPPAPPRGVKQFDW